MKRTLLCICLFLFNIHLTCVFAQSFLKQFEYCFATNDTVGMRVLIDEWELASPQDAELFTAKFNYYYLKSMTERLVLSEEPVEGSSVVLNDSTGSVAGYLSSEVWLDNFYLSQGYNAINEGIRLHPDRLDMRFGKIYLLGEQEEWGPFTEEIISTIRRSGENGNQWKWTNNEKYSDNVDDFLSSLQNYQLALYHTRNDSLILNMRSIAAEILKLHPQNVVNLSNIAITYIVQDDFQQAIPYLLKATEVDPTDTIILSNLARCYEMVGDKENAIRYYKKITQLKEEDMQQYAKQKIEELSK